MWQYNAIVSFLRNKTKTERPFPLYETPHLFRRFYNDSSLNKTMKNDSCPVAATPSHPVAATPSLRCSCAHWRRFTLFCWRSTGNRHCLWSSTPEQRDAWGLSSESWCGHGVKVERATEPWSFHCRPSSANKRVLSQPLSSSLVGLNRVFSRCYSSPCASVETCVSLFG